MHIYAALAVLAVLAVVSALATARRRQSAKAIGMVSKETEDGLPAEDSDLADSGEQAAAAEGEQLGHAEHAEDRAIPEKLAMAGARAGERLSMTLGGRASDAGRELERAVKATRADSGSSTGGADRNGGAGPHMPTDPEAIGVSRRQFFNRTIIMLMGMSLSSFGAACIAFLWPQGASGFGAKIKVGLVSDLLTEIRDNRGFLYKPEGRMWLTEYPNGAVEKAEAAYSAPELAGMTAGRDLGLDGGIVALYQKCPHLGCRVPNCLTSQWFECPCHGSKYNQVGEKRGGPAPRGMDRFAVEVTSDGSLVVDTGTIIQGPPIGTNTTGQEAEGPNCIGQATSH